MRKRLQALTMAAILLLSVLALRIPVMAAGTLTVSQVSGAKGEIVDVEILLTSDDVASGNFTVRYDSAMLELVSAKTNTQFQCFANANETGKVLVGFARSSAPIAEAVLCTLSFRVTENTEKDGSSVYLEQIRLYTLNGVRTPASAIHGSVTRKAVHLSMSESETAEYQSVRAIVELGGGIAPCGGNFSITYDPVHFAVRSVQPLEAMDGVSYEYHIVSPGLVRIAFSGTTPRSSGALFAVAFQTVGNAGAKSVLEISDAKMYDENSKSVDVSVTNGAIQIVVPSNDAPKLWVVGGALQEDGSAEAAIVLQGRGNIYGGSFTIEYDSSMTVDITPMVDCQYRHVPEEGEIHVSWASFAPYSEEVELLRMGFSDAKQSDVTIVNGSAVTKDGDPVPVVDIRPGKIAAAETVIAVVDEVSSQIAGSQTTYSVTVDALDQNYFSENVTESIVAVLALYEDGKLIGIAMDTVKFNSGTSEMELSAEAKSLASEIRVFLTDGSKSMVPLCENLNILQ